MLQKPNMIDTHIHLVPDVDDGAETVELALRMAWDSFEQGVSEMILTPHSSAFDFDARRTKQQFALLKSRMFSEITVHLGCEIYCEVERMEEICEKLRNGTYPTMNQTNDVLAEFYWGLPAEAVRERILPCVQALIAAGYTPIMAHVERYGCMQGNMPLMDELREMGCLLQVNAYSLGQEMNAGIKDWARQLATENKIDLLGTDAHRITHRPPSVAPGLQWLYANCDRDCADQMAWRNAKTRLCAGE